MQKISGITQVSLDLNLISSKITRVGINSVATMKAVQNIGSSNQYILTSFLDGVFSVYDKIADKSYQFATLPSSAYISQIVFRTFQASTEAYVVTSGPVGSLGSLFKLTFSFPPTLSRLDTTGNLKSPINQLILGSDEI